MPQYQSGQSIFNANYYEEGSSFGEIENLYKLQMDADVVALKDCHLAAIPTIEYKRVCENSEVKRILSIMKFYFTIPYLSSWQHESLLLLHSKSYLKKFRGNEVVFKDGDAVNFVYLVKEGKFVVPILTLACPPSCPPSRPPQTTSDHRMRLLATI